MNTEEQKQNVEKQERTHFAAVNSGLGFISYYKEVFGNSEIKRRYIIKGGPGTGKSSFMRKVSAEAEKRGKRVVYYRCSSDPSSLDGIVIDGRIALLDGTAPHIYEPSIVGAEDEIVNLGEFWDSDMLYKSYNDIASLSALKSNAYAKAYKFLSAAMNVEEINRAIALPSLLRGKLNAAVSRILNNIPKGQGFSHEYGFVNAIGMSGRYHLSTYENGAAKLYAVYDSYGLGTEFLSAVIDGARERKMKVRVSYTPLMPSLPDAVLLTESNIAFVLFGESDMEGAVKINMRRFIDDSIIDGIKSEYRLNRRLKDALLDSAVESLSEAGRYHFELEKTYISCMDFDAEDRFIKSFCKKIL